MRIHAHMRQHAHAKIIIRMYTMYSTYQKGKKISHNQVKNYFRKWVKLCDSFTLNAATCARHTHVMRMTYAWPLAIPYPHGYPKKQPPGYKDAAHHEKISHNLSGYLPKED